MRAQLDDLRLFAALPTAHLVLDADLVIRQVNPAYLRLVGLRAVDLIGRRAFDALPPGQQALDEDGVPHLLRSFEQVLATREPHTLPAQRYRVLDLHTGRTVERWCSTTTVPVLDDAGEVELLLQQVEEVTDCAHDRQARPPHHRSEQQWQARALSAETELSTRAHEARAARESERTRARELAALATATVRVASAEDVTELVEVLLEHGLAALGAHGGAVAVREADVVRLAISASLGQQARVRWDQLPPDSRVPAVVSAISGRRILLPNPAASLAYDHEHGPAPSMAEVMSTTGCPAWAVLPLARGGATLGSLVVAWSQAQTFTPAALEVLDAFAAQCAQALARIQVRQEQQDEAAETSKLAETLQRSLLSEPARPGGLQIVTRYRPAARRAQVGGDWYDSFVTSTGTTTLVVGDVVGHDREAAAAMGQVRNLLRGVAYTLPAPPAQVLTLLDRALRGLDVGALATAVLVTIERVSTEQVSAQRFSVEQHRAQQAAGTHLLRWSNAGHPPPLLIHPEGVTEVLSTEAELLLGFEPDAHRRDHEVLVRPGSTLLLYTDGLIERRHASIDDGLGWLVRTAATLAAATPADLCDELLDLVVDDAEDDIVLLALRT
ncbi:SpoIIE family protein phosphatase [Kineococcus esterisolvens]|uniref:SpoIIE family protein phosphatase n=1 Tax=unclassified Kineococcus TaxID=2621656 RepID=UPI003D7EFA92